MFTAHSTAQTPSASKYLQQLCKHFAHKVPAEWEPTHGEVTFSIGTCRMEAHGDNLTIRCNAEDDEKLAEIKNVIDRHIERFAWREELKLDWL